MKLKVITNDSDVSKTKLPCDSCHTNCCKEYVIFVNAHDIYRLSVGLGLAPESFLEIYGAKDFDLGIKVKEGLLDLALKQKDGTCMFLEESKDVLIKDNFVFEALYLMSRHRIHRIVIVDSDGKLSGIVSNSDILRLQTRSPQQMLYEIEKASSTDDLQRLHEQVQGLVVHLIGTGVRTPELVRLISHLNDRILIRLIDLLRQERHPDLPDGFALTTMR